MEEEDTQFTDQSGAGPSLSLACKRGAQGPQNHFNGHTWSSVGRSQGAGVGLAQGGLLLKGL